MSNNLETININLEDLSREKINHNIEVIKKSLKEYKLIAQEEAFLKLLKEYFESNHSIDLTPDTLRKIYIKIWKKVGLSEKDIYNVYLPKIDFAFKKKFILKEVKNLLPSENPNLYQVSLTIAKYLRKHINYPFFYWFYLSKINKSLKKTILKMQINKEEIVSLNTYFSLIHYSDPYMERFKQILRTYNQEKIKKFLITNFWKLSKTNQKELLEIFKGKPYFKNKTLYDYLDKASAYDILYKYHTGVCTHISLIADFLLKNLYNKKNTKFIIVENLTLRHAYNLALFEDNWKVYPIYIDFLQYIISGEEKYLFIDYGKHEYDIWWKINNIKLSVNGIDKKV